MKSVYLFVSVLALCAVSTIRADPKACHNITGTCLSHGFVCASEQVVPHEKRCDGIADCDDGTDEFLCESALTTPFHEKDEEERSAFTQATCVNCNCGVNTMTVVQSNPWFKFAINSPVDYYGLATGAPSAYGGRPCNSKCVSSIKMTFYKKTGVCRGWLCCARQNQCISCISGGACPASNNPSFFKRCYEA